MDSRNSIACRSNIPNSDRSRSSRENSSSRADQSRKNVHFTGPWHDASARPAVEFPFEKLDGRPLVYGSMGTLQNRQKHIFGIIAEACAGLDVQLVLSLGGGENQKTWGSWPANRLWWSSRCSLNCSSVRRCASPTLG